MKAQLVHLQGVTFTARGNSKHWVMMDGPEKFGGSEAASRPLELMLFSFAGCAGSDVASILEKKRAGVERFEIQVEAEQAPDYPKVFTKIHLTFQFWGHGVKEKDVERAIQLTETKYCPVWAMLRDNVEITYTVEIREPGEKA